MSTYGSLAVIIYKGVKKHNLFKITNASFFLEEFIEFYMNNAQRVSKHVIVAEKLHLLVSLFPTTEQLDKLLSSRSANLSKEMLILKLLLDIMTWYYKTTEKPLYKKLQKEVIPLALKFYMAIGNSALKEININLLSSGYGDGKISKQIQFMSNKNELIEYYRTELKELNNLTGGNDHKTYYL